MSDARDTLWEMEKRFWLDGADFYESHLADDAVVVLPYPALLMTRDKAIEGVRQGPRWASVEMSEQTFSRRGSTAVLAYHAKAWRDDAGTTPYECVCASTYVDDGDGTWLMMNHSQQQLTVADDATRDA